MGITADSARRSRSAPQNVVMRSLLCSNMFTVTYQDQSGSVLGSEMIKHSKLTRNGMEDELIKSVKNLQKDII